MSAGIPDRLGFGTVVVGAVIKGDVAEVGAIQSRSAPARDARAHAGFGCRTMTIPDPGLFSENAVIFLFGAESPVHGQCNSRDPPVDRVMKVEMIHHRDPSSFPSVVHFLIPVFSALLEVVGHPVMNLTA